MMKNIIVVCLFVCLAGSSFGHDEAHSSFERSFRAPAKLKKLVVKSGPPSDSRIFLENLDFQALNIMEKSVNENDALRSYFKNSVLKKKLGDSYAVIYLKNTDPITVKLQHLKSFLNFEQETVFLISGAARDKPYDSLKHANYFFKTITENLLKSGSYMVVALHVFLLNEKHDDDVFKNVVVSGALGSYLSNTLNLALDNIQNPKSLYLIGDDLGNVAISVMALGLHKQPDFIYCLNERHFAKHYYNELYVRQDHGKLVQKIHMGHFPYSYAARDIFPNNGAVHQTDVINMLADDILVTGSVVAGMCINFEAWKNNKCADLPQISLWNKKFPDGYIGRYYLEKKAKS